MELSQLTQLPLVRLSDPRLVDILTPCSRSVARVQAGRYDGRSTQSLQGYSNLKTLTLSRSKLNMISQSVSPNTSKQSEAKLPISQQQTLQFLFQWEGGALEHCYVEPIGIQFYFEDGQYFLQAYNLQHRIFENYAVKGILRFL